MKMRSRRSSAPTTTQTRRASAKRSSCASIRAHPPRLPPQCSRCWPPICPSICGGAAIRRLAARCSACSRRSSRRSSWTRCACDTNASLDTLRRLTERRAGHVAVADLNWKRLKPWRQAVAACFDDPQVLALIGDFDKCRVEYAADLDQPDTQHKTAGATLFAGWLARCVPRLRGRVRLAPVANAGARPGRLIAALFQSSRSQTELSLRRQDSPRQVVAEVRDAQGGLIRSWNFHVVKATEAELLHRSIDDPSRDAMLEAALAEE